MTVRVLSAHAGADTGGSGFGLAGAYRRDRLNGGDVVLRSTVSSSNYIDYPGDLPWAQAPLEAARADVLHVHNSYRTVDVLKRSEKPVVLHHHGTYYRDNAPLLNLETERRMARAVVSTLDLLDYGGDDLVWVPAAHDLDALARMRRPLATGRIRIGHAPTDRAIKSTEAFLAACAKLADRVEPVLIERRSWRECLALKGTCDVFFDQVILGYGNNAIEAWAMGLPVICGGAPATLDRMRDTFGSLPFLEATESTIADAIDAAIDPAMRAALSVRGQTHARRWHDGRETVARLTPIYSEQAELAA